MNKRFDINRNPLLSECIDYIELTLKCVKFDKYSNQIDIDTWENIGKSMERNKKVAENGFGFCITNFYEFGNFKRLIVINMNNCTLVDFNKREIASVIIHELGHLLNASERREEPNLLYCFTNQVEYNKKLHEEIKRENELNNELYADSYANLHGYGHELISTFDKQNKLFEQKIGFFDERVKSISDQTVFDGIIIPINKNGW